MSFVYQKFYLRLVFFGLIIVGAAYIEYFIWCKLNLKINDIVFILLSAAGALIISNIFFKHFGRFVISAGKILINDEGYIQIVLSDKVYKVCEIEEATFYTFKLYGVFIGEIYIEYKDENSHRKSLKILSEDLHDKEFIDTSLYQAAHLYIPNMKELEE